MSSAQVLAAGQNVPKTKKSCNSIFSMNQITDCCSKHWAYFLICVMLVFLFLYFFAPEIVTDDHEDEGTTISWTRLLLWTTVISLLIIWIASWVDKC